MKGFLLALTLASASVGLVEPLLQPPAATAQAPYFSTDAQLQAKFRRVQIGWTYAQVEALLGQPQWGGKETGIYNYFVNSRTLIKVINFRNGRVSGFGGKAG